MKNSFPAGGRQPMPESYSCHLKSITHFVSWLNKPPGTFYFLPQSCRAVLVVLSSPSVKIMWHPVWKRVSSWFLSVPGVPGPIYGGNLRKKYGEHLRKKNVESWPVRVVAIMLIAWRAQFPDSTTPEGPLLLSTYTTSKTKHARNLREANYFANGNCQQKINFEIK